LEAAAAEIDPAAADILLRVTLVFKTTKHLLSMNLRGREREGERGRERERKEDNLKKVNRHESR
jgi:hypothetical protein